MYSAMRNIILFQDDFSNFPIGEFPFDADHSAMGEYQYIKPDAGCGAWTDQVCNYTWNGTGPSWIITEENGKHFMESCRVQKNKPHRMFPTLQTGQVFWHDYDASCLIRRLSTSGIAGLAFCMQNSLNTFVFQLNDGAAELVYRHKENIVLLAQCVFEHNSDDVYTLSVSVTGDVVVCSVNGETLIKHQAPHIARGGKVGITADCPTQFSDVRVLVDDAANANIKKRTHDAAQKAYALQQSNPKIKLWKKINLKNFGTSRQIRFGHLTAGDAWHIVLAQAQKRISRDAYPHISCLTAIDLDGNVLWQRGEPSNNAAKLGKVSADLPFQVYDIDGDGVDEVICAVNFKLMILDGRTGAVKKSAPTPFVKDDVDVIGVPFGEYAFDRLNVDMISFANLSGKDRPTEILIKDRYCRLFALDSDLNVLWKYHSDTNTGHFPLAVDVNHDGKDEILCGYHLLNSDGQKLWQYPLHADHVDEIVYGKFMAGSDESYFACVAGSDGFYIGDVRGNIIKHDKVGHAQRVSIAQYDPQREGFEIAVSNFWGHQGIIYVYDAHGNPIIEIENELNGNLITPVNWRGDGQEYMLTNADPQRGGLYDFDGMQAVLFPDDGHPTLCAEAINLTGDARDELVVWDYHHLWIYMQDDAQDKNDYQPRKNPPHYNASNYRGESSGIN